MNKETIRLIKWGSVAIALFIAFSLVRDTVKNSLLGFASSVGFQTVQGQTWFVVILLITFVVLLSGWGAIKKYIVN